MAKKASEKKPEKKIIGKPKVRIENDVASASVDAEFDLDKIAATLPNAEYEPEQFPGLVFRIDDPKVVFLLFRSGKIVCTGAKKPSDVDRAVVRLVQELRKIKIG